MNRLTQICRRVEYSAAHYWAAAIVIAGLSLAANVLQALA